MGVLAGLWLRGRKAIPAKTLGLAAATVDLPGTRLSLVALVPAEQKHVDQFLCAGGGRLFAALLTFAFWAVEQKGWRKGWTWVWLVFGSNAIAAYMFSELLPERAGQHSFHRGRKAHSM